jgi:hypothetical protein
VLWRCFRHALGELFGVLGVLWWCFGFSWFFRPCRSPYICLNAWFYIGFSWFFHRDVAVESATMETCGDPIPPTPPLFTSLQQLSSIAKDAFRHPPPGGGPDWRVRPKDIPGVT